MEKDIFKQKTTSSFPIAIGSGLALESMFDAVIDRYDDDREIPNKVDLKEYKYHVWNIYTIIRNLLYSVEEKDKLGLLAKKEFPTALNEELDSLVNLYNNYDITVAIFIPKYKKVMEAMNAGKVTEYTKPMVETVAIMNFLETYTPEGLINTITGSHMLPTLEGKVLLTTHQTVDLLNMHNKITLLESNTGKLKNKHEWYTKYHPIGKRELDMIPMVEEILYLLGDHCMTMPVSLTTRLELYQLAIDKHWTNRTTREKIVTDIRSNTGLYSAIEAHKRMYY